MTGVQTCALPNCSSDRDSAWEISFRISTLLDLKKIMRHLEHSGLVYEFELDM